MQLILDNVIPQFLEKEKIASSQVWGKSIEIKQGERIQIVAASGRGKTSLVHFLYGLRNDYDGQILFENKNIQRLNAGSLADHRANETSIVFQDLRLFPDHTFQQNIEIKARLSPYHKDEIVYAMATQLGIATKLQQLCKKCSYGEQQRTAIIRAMQQPFQLLLLDEPFSNLDEMNRQKAMELINTEAAARNATIILFDLKELNFFSPDRILYL